MYEYNIQEALMSQRAGTFPEGISTSPGNPFAGTHPPGGPAPMHPSLPSALRAQVPAGYEAAASANSVGQPPSSGGGAVYSSSLILAGQDCNDGASTVAIDNKIEQAMDLVKSHLMFAVREEVEVLKEQIKELLEKNSQLEYENSILRSSASPETLSQLSAAAPAVVPSSQGPTKASQPPPPTTS